MTKEEVCSVAVLLYIIYEEMPKVYKLLDIFVDPVRYKPYPIFNEHTRNNDSGVFYSHAPTVHSVVYYHV
jgi:hypothetical protein